MRGVLLSLVLASAVALVAPRPASAAFGSAGTTMTAATTASVGAQQPATLDISVSHSGGRWYASPMWIAIGAIAVVLVLLMIVLVARSGSGGGGTTIVK